MTKRLTTSAIMIALAAVLSYFTIFPAPNGGDITIGSMVPIVLVALLYNTKWGIFTAITYSVVNMLIKGVVTTLPAYTLSTYLLMILIDYILAFGVLGLAGFFYRAMGKKTWAMPVSAAIVTSLRFVCHFISGILLWGSYAPEGQSVYYYSLLYNGGYMVPEIVITTVIVALLSKTVMPKLLEITK